MEVPRSSKNYTDYMHDLSAYHCRLACFIIIQSKGELERLQEAEVELKLAAQLEPESADILCHLGRLYSKKMETKVAIECIQMAMQMESWPIKNHRLYEMQLAHCYAKVKNVGCFN